MAWLRGLADHVDQAMELRHLTALTVPVERALDRRIRDEDFLLVTDDLAAPRATMPVTVVADSLRSSFNVGGVFRTGECFGIEEVLLTGYSADPGDPRVGKAAMGTADLVAWRRLPRARDAASALRERGARLVALETGDEHPPVEAAEFDFPCGLLLGNERFGLDLELLEQADLRVRIPTYGRKNSLNVVAALAVCLHAMRSRWARV